MANTLKFGNGTWATKEGSTLAYNDENGNFKPLPFDFSRNTTATRVNKEGLIEVVSNNEPRIDFLNDSDGALKLEPQRSNLALYSEQFDNAAWEYGGVTKTANAAISPDGTSNADEIEITTLSTPNIRQTILVNASTDYTFSFYAKSSELSVLKLAVFDLNGAAFIFENTEKSITDEWSRVTVSFTTPSGCSSIRVFIFRNSDSLGSFYVYGAQVEAGSYATSYIPTQGSAATRVAEVCSQTVPSGIIGQTEGTLFVDVDFDTLSGLNMFVSIRPDASNKIEIYRDGNIIYAETSSSNPFNISKTNITAGRHKIAFAYSSGSSAMYINGVLIGSKTDTFTFTSTLDDIYINSRGTSFIEQSNYNDFKLYNTRLSNAELATLTTL